MILYLDTSAFVKLYVDEPGAKETRALVDDATAVCTHTLSYAEMRAALALAHRMGRVDSDGLAACRDDLERDWEAIVKVAATWPLIRRAGDLAEDLGLRGCDAVHLAAAERVWMTAGEGADVVLATFDRPLAEAATKLGIEVAATG